MWLRLASIQCFLLALALSTTGCATVPGGSKNQGVKIASQPVGATVLVDGQPAGCTPTQVDLPRNAEHHVHVEKPGYQPSDVVLTRGFNPWLLGNVFVGGILGIVID